MRVGAVTLFQGRKIRTVVEMKGLAVDHQGGDRFDAGAFCLGHAVAGGAEVHNFQVDLGAIEIAGDGRFRLETNRAAGVIEGGSGFHVQRWR